MRLDARLRFEYPRHPGPPPRYIRIDAGHGLLADELRQALEYPGQRQIVLRTLEGGHEDVDVDPVIEGRVPGGDDLPVSQVLAVLRRGRVGVLSVGLPGPHPPQNVSTAASPARPDTLDAIMCRPLRMGFTATSTSTSADRVWMFRQIANDPVSDGSDNRTLRPAGRVERPDRGVRCQPEGRGGAAFFWSDSRTAITAPTKRTTTTIPPQPIRSRSQTTAASTG